LSEAERHHPDRGRAERPFPFPRTLWVDLGAILAPTLILTAAALWLGLDLAIAQSIFERNSRIGELGFDLSLASFAAAALLVAAISVPAVRRRWPLFVRASAVFVMCTIIAVMGFIQNTKLELSRPRPHEVKQLSGRYDFQPPFGSDPRCKRCNSFPSSAAGSAFLVATPYFVLRRRYPKTATTFLAVGLAWGAIIGYTRMVPGLHWFSDVVWSAAFVLVSASALSHLRVAWLDPPASNGRPVASQGVADG